jgi:hypothetical protein
MTTRGEEIVQLLRRHRLAMTTEDALQRGIHDVLEEAWGDRVKREVRLSRADRIDFMVDSVGVECKVKGGQHELIRQLLRYAEHPAITELVLVTTLHRHAVGLPAKVLDCPLRFHVVSAFQ